jgi:hypothetical protein
MWTITLHKKKWSICGQYCTGNPPNVWKNAWLQFKIHYNIAHKTKTTILIP